MSRAHMGLTELCQTHENFGGAVVRDGSKQLSLTRVNLPNGGGATGLARRLADQVMLGSLVLSTPTQSCVGH